MSLFKGKRLTTLSGTLFLVWLFFSPILAFYLVVKVFPNANIFTFLLAVGLIYVLLGMLYYRVCYYFGGVFLPEEKPIILSQQEYAQVKPDNYRGLLELIILLLTMYATRLLIPLAQTSPLFFGLFGLVLFVLVCMANWYKPLRTKVNSWLSFGEKNKDVAVARAESTLYTLNALLVVVSMSLLLVGSIYLF